MHQTGKEKRYACQIDGVTRRWILAFSEEEAHEKAVALYDGEDYELVEVD